MQNERTEGRSRPACARHPPRTRADRTTACPARWTDDCGSGETFSALAYTAKGCCITPNILPGDFLSPRACGPVECGGLQRAKIRRLRARGPRKSARISRPSKGHGRRAYLANLWRHYLLPARSVATIGYRILSLALPCDRLVKPADPVGRCDPIR